MDISNDETTYNGVKPKLLAIAYRILGSQADAQDAVQETFIKWWKSDRSLIKNEEAWLVKVCTRICIDVYRSAATKRVDYIGTWLPEPMLTIESEDIESSDSITTAFLLLLERLNAKERAAFVLRVLFDRPYKEVAEVLDVKESNCRKIVSRAKDNLKTPKVKTSFDKHELENFLTTFKQAVITGNVKPLSGLLAQEIILYADGGGKVPSVTTPIEGIFGVSEFILRVLNKFWQNQHWVFTSLNGQTGLLMYDQEKLVTALTLSLNIEGQVDNIFIVRNPDKLNHLPQIANLKRDMAKALKEEINEKPI